MICEKCHVLTYHYKINDCYYCFDCGVKIFSSLPRGQTYTIEIRKMGKLAQMIEVAND